MIKITLKTLLVFISICISTITFAKDIPFEKTQNLMKTFKKVKNAGEGKTLTVTEKTFNKKVFKELDVFFDLNEIVSNSIEPHKNKFSKSQLKSYKKVFSSLIRLITYPDSGEFLNESKMTIKKSIKKGKIVMVPIYFEVPKEDIEMDVVLHWKKSKKWHVIDASFDGSLLTKDYQNQFGRVITKKSVKGLLDVMKKRLKKEEKVYGS